MPLRVAVQMDPIETINIAGNSTFAIMLSAQSRGHQLYHYLADALTYADGRLYAGAHEVSVRAEPGNHFTLGEFSILDLGRDVDVVLMRQDPPFDLGYITATHLLERIQGETLVVNDPASVRNAPEKIWVLDFARFMPPTMVTRSLGAARKFLEQHGDIVIKPIHGFAGGSVFRIGSDGAQSRLARGAVQHDVSRTARAPEIPPGNQRRRQAHRTGRGEVAGAINRVPASGEIRSNLAVGGTAGAAELTDTEREICAALAPELKQRGLLFVGIDVIGGKWLTEINVTSPTEIVAIDKFNGTDTPGLIWDAIERQAVAA